MNWDEYQDDLKDMVAMAMFQGAMKNREMKTALGKALLVYVAISFVVGVVIGALLGWWLS